jgi:hypothetical protein
MRRGETWEGSGGFAVGTGCIPSGVVASDGIPGGVCARAVAPTNTTSQETKVTQYNLDTNLLIAKWLPI